MFILFCPIHPRPMRSYLAMSPHHPCRRFRQLRPLGRCRRRSSSRRRGRGGGCHSRRRRRRRTSSSRRHWQSSFLQTRNLDPREEPLQRLQCCNHNLLTFHFFVPNPTASCSLQCRALNSEPQTQLGRHCSGLLAARSAAHHRAQVLQA